MDVVLGDVDVEMVIAVLVYAGLFGAGADVGGHSVRYYGAG